MHAFQPETWLPAVGLMGLAGGAIAHACVEALSRERFRWPSLRCDACGTPRGALSVVPLIGWFIDRRCRSCRAAKSVQRPLIETGVCALWLLLAWFHGPGLYSGAMMLFVTGLVILSLIDLRCFLLPDVLTLPGITLGVAATWLPGWPVSLIDSALSAGLGYLAMMTLATIAESYYGQEAIGQGDWKMVALLGAFLGSTKLVTAVIIANGTGAVVGLLLVAAFGNRGRQKLPLGTFLGVSAIFLAFV